MKKIIISSFIFIALITIGLTVFKSNNKDKEISGSDNLKLESFLQDNNRKRDFFYCKYRYVIDGSYRKIPNSQQYVDVQFKNGTILVSGSERSVLDAWGLPFNYQFDEKTKILKSEGVVKYYIVNKRKIIIGQDPENHVGPIRTSIKEMPYQLTIKFDTYPIYIDSFIVDINATSDDGNLEISLSCKK
jgi:hypothetical protein